MKLIIPRITEEDLRSVSERTLMFAVAMYEEASKQADTPQEVIDIINASLVECCDRSRRMANEHSEDECAAEQARVHANMHTLYQTIASAALAMLPILQALEWRWTAEAEKERNGLN